MNDKETLHQIIDQLDSDHLQEALTRLRPLIGRSVADERQTPYRDDRGVIEQESAIPAINGVSLVTLQSKRPTDFDDLLARGWPDDDPDGDITEMIREWRSEGGYA